MIRWSEAQVPSCTVDSCPSLTSFSVLRWFLSSNPDSFFFFLLLDNIKQAAPQQPLFEVFNPARGQILFPSDKTIFPGGKNLDHQAALSSRIALNALITGPCVGKKKGKKTNLWGFRQPLNFPLATFISNNLHNFAFVRRLNLQKSLSKCKTKTLLEHFHFLISGKKALQAVEMFNHTFQPF